MFSTISDEDVKETADAVSALANAGALRIDRDVENRLRTMLSLPLLSQQAYDDYDKQPEQPATNKPNTDAPDNPDDTNQDLPDEAPKATAKV